MKALRKRANGRIFSGFYGQTYGTYALALSGALEASKLNSEFVLQAEEDETSIHWPYTVPGRSFFDSIFSAVKEFFTRIDQISPMVRRRQTEISALGLLIQTQLRNPNEMNLEKIQRWLIFQQGPDGAYQALEVSLLNSRTYNAY